MSSTFFTNSITPSFTPHPSKSSIKIQFHPGRSKLRSRKNTNNHAKTPTCRASSSSSSSRSSSVSDFDLYEILGVDSSSDQSEIKRAYRTLQKRCHPDIAGAAGHDMAIILNEVYSLLSDPSARSAYDQVSSYKVLHLCLGFKLELSYNLNIEASIHLAREILVVSEQLRFKFY